ncbi:LysE family transporter [Gallaecimonas sp. GXIMD4217]|uniref:LysE/ArgO family amino acid transporter n=1 Tax=Gallaecimonas sp. GXIMD4217 TaxID=3131927 RepID=UPI00311B3EB6
MLALVFLKGLATAAGLIMSIGAQNVFVLSQGLRRQHHLLVAAICAGFDLLFIGLGVAGLAALLTGLPVLVRVLQLVGGLYLLYLAWEAAKRWRQRRSLGSEALHAMSWRRAAATALAVTLLNPQVFLETALVLGTLADAQGEMGKWVFAAGAMTTSVLWFFGLGIGAARLAPVLARPSAWRWIDGLTAVLMTAMALVLLLP